MAQYIKDIVVANPYSETNRYWEPADTNTYWLSTDHIKSTTFLPQEHPVRKTLAAASDRAYLQIKQPKFAEETQDYPSFGADLQELKLTLNGLRYTTAVTFEVPLTEKDLELR
ncbi:uncharacterized protein N7477_005507 [Penicillium maclennaniae]|uniref:uncharacterized protein n=1 Tax=Penicillium maclennaniae TaxID=1343394 RepID=UPI002541487B|nr:uncharacterized protein N7477_005507 [Penicillium maclennaniae]KAJ5670144.1 hypothetical protein N7477_005507 [Penicillium maclennaniae]